MGIEPRSKAGMRPVSGASRAGAVTMRAAVQHRYGPPSVLETSEVAAVGKDVTPFRPGDEVFGWSTGDTLAEYACVPADQLVSVPAPPSTKQPTPSATSRPATREGRS